MSFRPLYKIRDWMPNINHLDYENILNNEHAIHELEKNDMVSVKDLSGHPEAIHLLERDAENIDYIELSYNPAAVHMFEKAYKKGNYILMDYHYNFNKQNNKGEDIHRSICLHNVFENPAAVSFIERNFGYLFDPHYRPSLVDYMYDLRRVLISALCKNENAIHLLEKIHPDYLNLESLLKNKNGYQILSKNEKLRTELFESGDTDWLCFHNEWSLKFLMSYNDSIIYEARHWMSLHYNESDYAVSILLKNIDKIDWDTLCFNKNPRVVELLRQNKDKINWKNICQNSSAIDLIEEKAREIQDLSYGVFYETFDISTLAENPSVFTIDTDAMKSQIDFADNPELPLDEEPNISFVEELVRKTLSPQRMARYLRDYNYNIVSDEYDEYEE